jgi:hypothetical protein
MKRKNLPTFCTVVSGFRFKGICDPPGHSIAVERLSCATHNTNLSLSVRVDGVHAATRSPKAATRIKAPSGHYTELDD